MQINNKFRMLVKGNVVGPVVTLVRFVDRTVCTNPMCFVDDDYKYTPEENREYITQKEVFAVLQGISASGKLTEFTVWNNDTDETYTNEQFPVRFKKIEE